jgi:hypothetical protein
MEIKHFFSLMMLLAMMLGYALRCEYQDDKTPAMIIMLIIYFAMYNFLKMMKVRSAKE